MPLQANLIRLRNLLERQQSLTERGVPMSLLARPQDSMEDMIEQVLVGTIHWILEAVPDKFYKVSSSVKGPIWRFEGEGASGMGYDGTVTITYTSSNKVEAIIDVLTGEAGGKKRKWKRHVKEVSVTGRDSLRELVRKVAQFFSTLV